MNRSTITRLALSLCTAALCLSSPALAQKGSAESYPGLDKKLMLDPSVVHGKLPNGLTYYIRKNAKPENRAELRLVVNAGSTLEEPDQQGLAHFVEHMAFNGSKNFKKQELINYLESIGIRFGADLNAYTNTDETVYMLTVPTDTASMLERAFLVLEDWAFNLSFDPAEIDKERGVITEEWRLRRSAEARMREIQNPILLKDSRYGERNTIGNPTILDTFHHDRLKKFYTDWYRPDLMAIVAVGDFDVARIEKLIKQHFSGYAVAKNAPKRGSFPVPDHKETLFAIATDKEASRTSVALYYKRPTRDVVTASDYRRSIVEQLYNGMLNARLNELTQQSDPPFLFGVSGNGDLTRTKDAYALRAGVPDNGVARGLDALLTEASRVRRHGFTKSELERQKEEMMTAVEQSYAERDKTESADYAGEYAYHFLDGDPVPGIEFEKELITRVLPGITLDEVNRLAAEFITDGNRVITINAPQKDAASLPSQRELLALFDAVEKKDIAAYEDKVSDDPLVRTPAVTGSVVKEESNQALGTTEWTLSNGVRVIMKPTDFKNDEVSFTAFSPGGTSVVADKDYVSASFASTVVAEGGLGTFNQIELQKKLAGKAVGVGPFIGELQEGLSGGSTPKDLETMFQLIHLYFTQPRKDSTAFQSLMTRLRSNIKNRSVRPETAFGDTLQVTLAQYHPRRRPVTETTLDQIQLDRAFDIYRERFGDAGDFTFIFVGNFDPAAMKPLVLTYLGSLPSTKRAETWRDLGITPPKGVVAKSVEKGLEPKSQVRLAFTGPFEWTRENRFALQSMGEVLSIMLRESIREEKGGTYGVGVSASSSQFPKPQYTVNISFGCAPDRVDELVKGVFAEIENLKKNGASTVNIQKVKETERRELEVSLKDNRFWLGSLQYAYVNNLDPMIILDSDKMIETLTPGMVQDAAKRYLDMNNYVKVVLYPEPKTP